MLQVKNLVKRYHTKGETVTALDGVSVNFPERGMVFLLGKSGSGKSTLLNVSGGLDAPDEGEVIVKGKSSKDFSKSDFDSYRNTYVGFIFQEYNILNELTIAENVALAIELQGKPRDEKLVNSLLEQVGLEGLGDRRPNTLSGGQKQRVAIARALVKNPEIIMADEPTGALDSATGTQVLDTLKDLSREKLVVVVSHDREFAEKYADRIIELKDGQIISDVSRGEGQTARENVFAVSDKTLTVNSGISLTDEEAERILAFVKKNKGSVVISTDRERVNAFAAENCGQSGFVHTQAAEVVPQKDESNFIKSSFPLRYAVKMGVSGLKFKPVRLAFTILLATLAFIVFGVFSTLLTFNANKIAANTLANSDYGAAVFQKNAVLHFDNGSRKYELKYSTGRNSSHFTREEIQSITKEFAPASVIPAYTFDDIWTGFRISQGSLNQLNAASYYKTIQNFTAFAEASYLADDPNFTLIEGRFPQSGTEIVISKLVYETFLNYGWKNPKDPNEEVVAIEKWSDLEGKQIYVYGSTWLPLTIVGVIDPHEEFPTFEKLKTDNSFNATQIVNLQDSFAETFKLSMSSLCYVSDEFYELNSEIDKSRPNYNAFYSNLYKEDGTINEEGLSFFKGTQYRESEGSHWQYLFVSLNTDRAGIAKTVMSRYNEVVDTQTDVYYFAPYVFISEIRQGNRLLNTLISIVGSAAGVLAVFAALLLFNFISASINAKKKDIGILRAVGARSVDVFKIFLVEGLVITLLCFALGCIGSVIACAVANFVVIDKAVLTFNFFLFDGLNALIVLGIALVTALIATAIPVALNARKKPVDAIRAI